MERSGVDVEGVEREVEVDVPAMVEAVVVVLFLRG